MLNFDRALEWTWRPGNEGPDDGGVATPGDSGGFTRLGVTLASFKAWRQAHREVYSEAALSAAPLEELKSLYRSWYWTPVGGDELPTGVDLVVWDFGVTSGPGRAAKFLQSAVGATPDGAIGPLTLKAVVQVEPGHLVEILTWSINEFDRGLDGYAQFGRGWDRRRAGARELALDWIKSEV